MIADFGLWQYFIINGCFVFLVCMFTGWLLYAKSRGRKVSSFDKAVVVLFLSIIYGMGWNMYTRILRLYTEDGGVWFKDTMESTLWGTRYIPLVIAGVWFTRLAIMRIKKNFTHRENEL